MGQSLNKIYVHLVFSTKHRQPLIGDSIKEELFSYLGGICKNLECNPIQVGGNKDHVHVLFLLSKKIALMDLIEKVKSNSSKWIKTKGIEFENFYWQNGYGAFSVNPTEIEIVKNYIINQRKHHETVTFKSEFLDILEKHEMEYDEKYLWD